MDSDFYFLLVTVLMTETPETHNSGLYIETGKGMSSAIWIATSKAKKKKKRILQNCTILGDWRKTSI